MANKIYTITEAAKRLNVTKRTIQRRLSKLETPIHEGAYVITEDVMRILTKSSNAEYKAATPTTPEAATMSLQALQAGEVIEQADGSIIECFSQAKYEQLEQALVERQELKIELREMQKRLDQLQQWKEDFMRYTNQRNTIEAHEKGVIASTDEVEEISHEEIIQKKLANKRLQVITNGKAKFTDWLQSLE